MRLRLIAVGTRMPDWVDAAFADYVRRLHGHWKLELIELTPERRHGAASAADAAKSGEARRMLPLLAARDFVVALDERGHEFNTRDLAQWLEGRRASGQDLVFLIGGADGLAPAVRERAHYTWSLSRLTLPHGLARVVLAEQLYRAATLLSGHPYHRE